MFSLQDAFKLHDVARRAKEHEARIDLQLKAGITANVDGTDYDLGDDGPVAEYLRDLYRAGGWKVEIASFDPDRAHGPAVTYTLRVTLPTGFEGDG